MDHCVVKKWDEDRCGENTEGTWRKKEGCERKVKEQKRQWRGNNLLPYSKTSAHTHTQEHNACKSRRRSQSVANDTSSGISTHEEAPNTAREFRATGYKLFCCATDNWICRCTRSEGLYSLSKKVRVKQSCHRPGVAQRFPGS